MSAELLMIPSPSRSHWTAAPVTNIEPSSAYVTPPPMPHASVTRSPGGLGGREEPAFIKTKDPVPYVFFVAPVEKHVCPKSADCWSPAMPLTGIAASRNRSGSVTPNRPLDGNTSGRSPSSTPNTSSSSGDQAHFVMSYNSVREAFE